MHLLLDANLPRSLANRIRTLGLEATDVRDIGLADADDEIIAAIARQNGHVILTRDFDFADIRNYPPADYAGIIVLDLPNEAHVSTVVEVVEKFLTQDSLVEQVYSHLVIVEPGRIRIR